MVEASRSVEGRNLAPCRQFVPQNANLIHHACEAIVSTVHLDVAWYSIWLLHVLRQYPWAASGYRPPIVLFECNIKVRRYLDLPPV